MTELPAGEHIEADTKIATLLLISGIACLGIGTVAVVSPATIASQIGYAFTTPGGRGEFMTFYGGFYIGIGLFLLLAARYQQFRSGAFAFLALSATTAIPVRLYGFLQLGASEPVFYQLLFGELLFATAGWIGLYLLNQTDKRKLVSGD